MGVESVWGGLKSENNIYETNIPVSFALQDIYFTSESANLTAQEFNTGNIRRLPVGHARL